MKKGLFAIFFLVLMVVLGGASVAGYINTRIYALKILEETTDVHPVYTFVGDYPFTDDEDNPKPKPESKNMSVPEWIAARTELFTNSENPLSLLFRTALNIYYHDMFLNGENPFIRLDNGFFTYFYPYSHPVDSWNSLLNFVIWLRKHDIRYLALIAADKGDDTYAVFPEGVPHGYSRMAEEYTAFHEENDIEYLESRKSLVTHNSDFFYWFYKADHHWNVHAGLLMAEETARRLNAMNVDADTDAVIQEKFTLTCYPKSFLGSMGRKLGLSYKEDMEVFYPTGESSFHLRIPSLGMDRTGSFEKTLIAGMCLSPDKSSYYAFLHGDPPLVRIENLLSDNTSRVLVIKKSKADILCPYLAFAVRYLDVINPQCFDGSIRSFIEQTKPDIVITCNDVMYEGDEKFWRLR